MMPTVSLAPWLACTAAFSVACVAWWHGSLTLRGAMTAGVVGTVALAADTPWGIYLVLWFILAALWSRAGHRTKSTRTAGVIAKPGARDGFQVLANGGVFSVCALGALWLQARGETRPAWVAVAAAGALAAAGADTWSTEIGTWRGGTPWSLRSRGAVPHGTSGAVTWAGSLGGLLGAASLAALSALLGMVPRTSVVAVLLGGLAGAWTDTVLGAFVQEVRRCPRCDVRTECNLHPCGTRTVSDRGLRLLGNDAVNWWCTIVGALVSVGIGRLMEP